MWKKKKSFPSVQIPKPSKYSLPYPTSLHKGKPYSKASPAKHAEEKLQIMRYASTLISGTVDFLYAEAVWQITLQQNLIVPYSFFSNPNHTLLFDWYANHTGVGGGGWGEVWLQLQDHIN